MKFYNEVSPLLKRYIRHYWHVNSKGTDFYGENILLPMDHVDLIMSIKGDTVYNNGRDCHPERIHFHGIRKKSVKVTQRGKLLSIGISFTPWGFYFFIQQPMSQFVNKTINLSDINYSLWKDLSDRLERFDGLGLSEFVTSIEKSLIKHLNPTEKEHNECRTIEEFLSVKDINVMEFCKSHQISLRKLERIFEKYIGISPKRFKEVIRFEESSKDVLYNNESSLTDISYKHGFYDQSHFGKVFKNYTNYSPRHFQSDKPALKSHINYNYEQDKH